jgi:hypothetical protein
MDDFSRTRNRIMPARIERVICNVNHEFLSILERGG